MRLTPDDYTDEALQGGYPVLPKVYGVDFNQPHQVYISSDGHPLPGASTIAKLYPDGGGLFNWYAMEERKMILDFIELAVPKGSFVTTDLEPANYLRSVLPKKSAASAIFERAGRIGTIAHRMIEAYVNGGTFDATGLDALDVAEAEPRYKIFVDWWNASGYRLHSSERQFACDRWGFGGTIDLIGQAKDGSLHLLDVKTSNSVRVGHKVQVGGGYRLGCEDALGLHVSAVKIIHCGAGMKAAKPIVLDLVTQAWAGRAFLACLELWKVVR